MLNRSDVFSFRWAVVKMGAMVLLCTGVLSQVQGAIVANYEFTGGSFSNPDLVSTDTDPNTTASDLDSGTGLGLLSLPNGIPPRTLYFSTALNNATEADAITANKYINFTITPGIDPLDLDSLTFSFQRDDPVNSVTTFSIRSDAGGDNYATQLFAGSITGATGGANDFFAQSADLSSITLLQGLTAATDLRVYFYGASASANTRLDNLQLNSTVIPEPSSLAMLLIGSVGAAIRRRRRR